MILTEKNFGNSYYGSVVRDQNHLVKIKNRHGLAQNKVKK